MRASLDKVRESPQSTKARILLAAEEVFAEKGFDGASTREIAARARVNISSLHYHWESKETLYVAVFERIYQQLFDTLQDDFAQPASREDARAVIARAMGRAYDFFADHPTVPRLLMRRIMDADGFAGVPARDAMGPAWKVFGEWTRGFVGGRMSERDVGFLMLTVQSVLLVVMLDSPHVAAIVGGSVKQAAVRNRLRTQVIGLVETLVGVH
ncbi:MAG TPA: TetR/AcrR family transcriptional regulator [Candidatus Binatia bacterium]|nr:TetR/AcrR family transcriptional regulator [Candidatus Binatia bacterium]